MRFFAFLEYAFVILGAIGMVASQFFHLPKGFHLGLFLVGAGFALAGLESLATRRMSFRFATHGAEGYAGPAALIWGAMALVVGLAVIASAYLMEEGLWRTTVNALERHPAPLLAAGGLLAVGAGALLMFHPRRHGIAWTLFVRVPKTLFGVLLVVGGIAAIALGVLEWFEPQAYELVARKARAQFDFRLIERFLRNPFGLRT